MRPAVEQPGSAADSLLGPQEEMPRKGGDAWDVSMCESWAVNKLDVTIEAYRAYLIRVYGSATELDSMMLWDQQDALKAAVRNPAKRQDLINSIRAASRKRP